MFKRYVMTLALCVAAVLPSSADRRKTVVDDGYVLNERTPYPLDNCTLPLGGYPFEDSLAFTAMLRKHFVDHPDHFDPRQYLTDARKALGEMVQHKIVNVLGCNGKA